MKQNITQEQWGELERLQKYKFIENIRSFFLNFDGNIENFLPNIGQMIEFLDFNFRSIKIIRYGDSWVLGESCDDGDWIDRFEEKELCDALWKAVKDKLKMGII